MTAIELLYTALALLCTARIALHLLSYFTPLSSCFTPLESLYCTTLLSYFTPSHWKCARPPPATSTKGGVISELVISYISWDQMTPVIRLIAFRADIISARALGKLL